MDTISKTNELFFNKTELDEAQIMPIISDALSASDDGELFLEESHSESLVFDDGRMKASNYDRSIGFGLRGISGEAHGYAHSDEMTIDAIKTRRKQSEQLATAMMGILPSRQKVAIIPRFTLIKTRLRRRISTPKSGCCRI